MVSDSLRQLAQRLQKGELVPYLGSGALTGVIDPKTSEPIPADSDSLILAMNQGRPMNPRLMWEFPRAAMDVELKRGRSAVNRFLNTTYGSRSWTRAPLHDWLATLPILFKPMGSPRPDATYIASDADYVDYLTELMGGFAVPGFLKDYRRGRQYLLLGLRLTRDTERMVLSDIVYAAGSPTGFALIPEPTDKEWRFCDSKGVEVIEAGIPDLLRAAGWADPR